MLETSRWEGKVEVANAIIAGEVKGDVVAAERLEIRKSARIHGSVHAGSVAVAEGAIIDGEVGVTPDASVTRFQEKRKRKK